MEGYHGTIGVMGGEPTLHPEFERFTRYLHAHLPKGVRKEKLSLTRPQKDVIESVLLENKINIPTANAISVDIGIQNPLKNGLFLFMNININAGTITPPMDAKTGKEAFLKDDRLPCNISAFISKPATRKNIDIKNSFINICIENSFTMYMSFNI